MHCHPTVNAVKLIFAPLHVGGFGLAGIEPANRDSLKQNCALPGNELEAEYRKQYGQAHGYVLDRRTPIARFGKAGAT